MKWKRSHKISQTRTDNHFDKSKANAKKKESSVREEAEAAAAATTVPVPQDKHIKFD